VVQVTYGVNSNTFDVAGRAVAYVRENLATLYGIPTRAVALVNGEQADETHVLYADDEVDFLLLVGSKGVGNVWTDDEMCQKYQVTTATLDLWEQQGCRVMRGSNGSRRWTETALDEFYRGDDGLLPILNRIEEKVIYSASEYLTIKTTAQTASLSSSHIRRAVRSGDLPASNVGTADRPVYRIARKDLAEWMEKKKGETLNVPPSSELKNLIDRHLPGLRGRNDSATR
jgi:excisionase family DNA binding protein